MTQQANNRQNKTQETTQNVQQKNTVNKDRLRLPREPNAALRMLIKVTDSLNTLAERENQALAKNDMIGFAIMQDEKNVLAGRYTELAQDFQKRVNEFRGADKALINRLEKAQETLHSSNQANNKTIGGMMSRARETTQSTLFTAQELGQTMPTFFPQDHVIANEAAKDAADKEGAAHAE